MTKSTQSRPFGGDIRGGCVDFRTESAWKSERPSCLNKMATSASAAAATQHFCVRVHVARVRRQRAGAGCTAREAVRTATGNIAEGRHFPKRRSQLNAINVNTPSVLVSANHMKETENHDDTPKSRCRPRKDSGTGPCLRAGSLCNRSFVHWNIIQRTLVEIFLVIR